MDKLAIEIFLKAFSKYEIGDKVLKKGIKALQTYHEAKLKEELEKFSDYVDNAAYGDICVELFVDEYLKQRNNGTI